MTEDEEQQREADRMLAGAIYLMTCHARSGCPRLAAMVGCHFKQLARNPHAGELVRDMCRRLEAAWEAVRRHDERRACEMARTATEVPPTVH